MKGIFKWFTLQDGGVSIVRLSWFVEHFTVFEFHDVDRMLFAYLEYCAKLGIPAIKKYLDAFVRTEGRKVIRKYNIKLATMDNYNYNEPAALEEAFRVIRDTCYQAYDSYCEQELDEGAFKVDMQMFFAEGRTNAIQRAMAEAFPKLSSGGDSVEIAADLQARLDTIQTLYDEDDLDELDFLTNADGKPKDKDRMEFLFNTGLPCFDGDTGGVHSKQVIAEVGPPGSGKSRLAFIHGAYSAMVDYGLDVRIDELELSKMEVENIMIAYHLIRLYNGQIKIPDKVMNRRNPDGSPAMTPEQLRYYEAARMDLFESGKYGRCDIHAGKSLNVFGLMKRMYTYLRNNRKCRLWIIDYAGLAEYNSDEKYAGHKEEYEIIQDLYKISKKLANKADIAVWIVNQFTKEGNAANDAGKTIMPGHIQGGQIIDRHADYSLVMTMTPEQKLAKQRCLSSGKVRAATGFSNVEYMTDLSVSIFNQKKQLSTN